MALSTGTKLGNYVITEPIGAGGMGEVYAARDPKLGRSVAIKILPQELSKEATHLSRLEREARALAALSHPNILTVFELGEADEVSFAVTELLEGETLRSRLDAGALSMQQAIDIVLQIARGLAAAHEKGIVHRDIKPENVFVNEDGHVKILDFGLAKQSPAKNEVSNDDATWARDTMPGTVLGTAGYMSPEQVQGKEADARSDVFSVGVVFLELLLGERVFSKETAVETMNAILREEPSALARAERELPPAIARIARRCLEKSPAERFESARELVDALKAISGVALEPAAKPAAAELTPSVAVLPFADMSPAKDQDYFCEGIAEEIINALHQIKGLRVASRTSTFQFKGRAQDIRDIGARLQVGSILEGSVRTAGKKLRVTARLTSVQDGYQQWSERYDRDMEDVFAIQDEIAASIVTALRGKLGDEVPDRGSQHTKVMEAYRLYLKGRQSWYLRELGSLSRAAEYFERAAELDPDYALAHAAVAQTYCSLGVFGYPADVARERSARAVEKALELDDGLAEVHAAVAMHHHYNWDWSAAEASYRKSLELDPHRDIPYSWFSYLLGALDRHDEAIDIASRARKVDPLSPFAHGALALTLLAAGRNEDAVAAANVALDIDGDFVQALISLSAACSRLGRHEEAITVAEKLVDLSRRSAVMLGCLVWTYAAAGRRSEAEAILDEIEEMAKREYVAIETPSWGLAALGRMDETFALLDEMVEQKNPHLIFYKLNYYDEMRADPRFERVLERMNLRA